MTSKNKIRPVAGVLLITVGALVVLGLTQGEARAVRVVRWVARRAPILDERKTGRVVERLALRLRELGRDRSLLIRDRDHRCSS